MSHVNPVQSTHCPSCCSKVAHQHPTPVPTPGLHTPYTYPGALLSRGPRDEILDVPPYLPRVAGYFPRPPAISIQCRKHNRPLDGNCVCTLRHDCNAQCEWMVLKPTVERKMQTRIQDGGPPCVCVTISGYIGGEESIMAMYLDCNAESRILELRSKLMMCCSSCDCFSFQVKAINHQVEQY